MRHRVKGKKLGRTKAQRKALAANMASQLIDNEKLETTLAKAKNLRPYIEKLVTKARKVDTQNKMQKFNTVKYLRKYLRSEDSIKKLIEEIGPKYKSIKGGYTKVTRTKTRQGDNAVIARIEFVEVKNEKNKK